MDHQSAVELKLSELLAERSDLICDLAIGIRRVIADRSCSASELLYSGYAVSNVFSYTHRLREAFIHVATYSSHVNLGFNYGSKLPDPDSVLCGNGKLIRHVRIESLADLEDPKISELLDAAIELGSQMADDANLRKPQAFIDKSK